METKNKREKQVEEGLIIPVKGFFSRTKTKEILSSYLYENLQRAIGNPEYFFKLNINKGYSRSIFNTLTDVMMIDTNKVPEGFLKAFKVDPQDTNLEEKVKGLFKKARFIDELESHRIILIEDKIIIFRNEERLIHKEEDKFLTQGEKRRTEIFTTFATFGNIYDAVRSQHHILDKQQGKKEKIDTSIEEITKLMEDIKEYLTRGKKDPTLKRRLEDLITSAKKETDANIMAAILFNFKQITFENKSIDSNRLLGGKNKFKARFDDIETMMGTIQKHLVVMENILNDHEDVLELFVLQACFAKKELYIGEYERGYRKVYAKYGDIAPFSIFYNWIQKYKYNEEHLEKFVTSIRNIYKSLKEEHEDKINKREECESKHSHMVAIKEFLTTQEMENMIKGK